MNVTKITVGRLYNLGNYEHIRYELTLEVPAGESPATAMRGVENIITALDPHRPHNVKTTAELLRMREHIEQVKAMPDDAVAKLHGKSKVVVLYEWEKQYTHTRRISLAWHEHQARARRLLEDIGGAAKWEDAKQNWDDYDSDL